MEKEVSFNLWFAKNSPPLHIFSMESLDWRQLFDYIQRIPYSDLCCNIFQSHQPWRWKHYVTPIFFHPLIKLHGVPDLMTSNPAYWTEVFVRGLLQNFIARKFVLRHYLSLQSVRCPVNAALLC